jgi:peptidoglycan/xylan/chitin deacetylase (PgdA/CDA1 family)
MKLIKNLIYSCLLSFLFGCNENNSFDQTEITKWKYDKKGAISITYDDGNINQFKNAMPVMDRLGLPGTFFIVTGEVPGSQYRPKFIGRPVEEIIKETATIPTNKENFFERASAVGYLGYKGTLDFHFKAGSLFEAGKINEAYKIIDDAYANVRAGKFSRGKDTSWEAAQSSANTWDDFKRYAAKGHEFGSHTITHPRLAVLDEPNMLYELEKSKEDIISHMGTEFTFSAECPFGTEDERVMEYAHKIYPSLRNRMPESFLEELNRGNKKTPGSSDKEYVQWQRGAVSRVPMNTLESWVDTVTAHNNIWLVLVFHGVDGIGWEPRTTADLQTYFEYIKKQDDKVWVATFGNVTKYMRERTNTKLSNTKNGDKIMINLAHNLDSKIYDNELTLKTYISTEWKTAQVKQDGKIQTVKLNKDGKGNFILYEAKPNMGTIEISKAS